MTFNLQGSLRAKYLDGKKTINIDSDITDISGSLSAKDASFSNIDIGDFSINPIINYDFTSSNNTFVDNIYTFKDGRTAQAKYINNALEEITWNHNEGITFPKNSYLEVDTFDIKDEFTIELAFKVNELEPLVVTNGNSTPVEQGIFYFGLPIDDPQYQNTYTPPVFYVSVKRGGWSHEDPDNTIALNFSVAGFNRILGTVPQYTNNTIHVIMSIFKNDGAGEPYKVNTWINGSDYHLHSMGGVVGAQTISQNLSGERAMHIIGMSQMDSGDGTNLFYSSGSTVEYIKYYDFPINDTQAKNMYRRYKEPLLIVNGDISCNGFLRGDGSKLSNIDTLPDKKEGLFLSKTHTGVEWIADVSLNNVDVSNNVNIGGSQTISNVFNINSGIIELYNTNNQIINSNSNYESIILDSLNKYYIFWNFEGKDVTYKNNFSGLRWNDSTARTASPFRHANLNGYTILGEATDFGLEGWWQKAVNIEENENIIYNSNTGAFIVPIDGIYQIRLNCVFEIYAYSVDGPTEHDILPPDVMKNWVTMNADNRSHWANQINGYLENLERDHERRCDLPISIRIKPNGIGNLWSETYDGWWDLAHDDGWLRSPLGPSGQSEIVRFGGPGAGDGSPSTIEEAFSAAADLTRNYAGTAFTLFQNTNPNSSDNGNIYLYYYKSIGPQSASVDWKFKFRVDKFSISTVSGTPSTQPGIIKSHERTSYPFSYKIVGDNVEITLVEDISYPFITYINNAHIGATPTDSYWNYAVITMYENNILTNGSVSSSVKGRAFVPARVPPAPSFRYIYIERTNNDQFIEIAFIHVLANVNGVVTNITQGLPDGVNTTNDALSVSAFHYTDRAHKGHYIFDHTEPDWPNFRDVVHPQAEHDNQRILVKKTGTDKAWARVDLGQSYKVSDIYHVAISGQVGTTAANANAERFYNVKFCLSEWAEGEQSVASFTNVNNSSIVFEGELYDPTLVPELSTAFGGPASNIQITTTPLAPSSLLFQPHASTAPSGWSDDGTTFKWIIPKNYFNIANGFHGDFNAPPSGQSVHYILTLSLAHIYENDIPDWSKKSNNNLEPLGFMNAYTTPFVINTDSSWTAEANPRGDTSEKRYTSIGQISVLEQVSDQTGGNFSNVSTSITRELKRYDQILYTIDKIDDINSTNNDRDSECWFTEETSGSIHRICP